ncbi:uncharacterized protein [Dermacentor andersoni]|uniref:uncharacterized protein isoform X2 n=1 Tax=Dermacentor andersoni TaxID=34620 RepID=UPI002417AF23|nr:elastin-like [Dermacentor andersoni]
MKARHLLVFLATSALVVHANAAPSGGTKTGVHPGANHAAGIPGAAFPQPGVQGAGVSVAANPLAGIHGGRLPLGGMSHGPNESSGLLVTLPGQLHAPGHGRVVVAPGTVSGSSPIEGTVSIGGTGSSLHRVLQAVPGQGPHSSGHVIGGHQGSHILQVLPQTSHVGFPASAANIPGGPSVSFGHPGPSLGPLGASHSIGLGHSEQAGPLAAGSTGYGSHGGSSSSASGFSVSSPLSTLSQGLGSGSHMVGSQAGSTGHTVLVPVPAPAVVVVAGGASAGTSSGSPISHAGNTAAGVVPPLLTAQAGNLHSSVPALGGLASGSSSALPFPGRASGVKH